MTADLNGRNPLYVACPTCGVDAGTACNWHGVTVAHADYHWSRVERAQIPVSMPESVTDAAFAEAVDANGLV